MRMGERRKRKAMSHILEELIAEILLSNVPIKTLLRFKSVSKSWRSLISSPEFVQDHLNISNSDPHLAHLTLIRNHCKDRNTLHLRSCSLKSLLDEPNQNDVVSTLYHPYPTTIGTYCSVKFLGSCNGLLFIKNSCGYSLWNPSTRKLKKIPQPSSSPPQEKYADYEIYGFGYDDSTHDYKVVCIMSFCKPGYPEIHKTKIYSVRNHSSKTMKNFGKHFQRQYPGIFVNGKLHWLGAMEEDKWNIVSLDLAEGQEKYQVVATPKDNGNCTSRLENLGGYLSLISCSSGFNPDMTDINVWVMMKYGAVESWTKIWSVPKFDLYYCRPFWVTKNGDIFVLCTKQGWTKRDRYDYFTAELQSEVVAVYNGNNLLREYPIDADELDDQYYRSRCYSVCEHTYRPVVYLESLVSP